MPNTASAKKRLRQDVIRRDRNRARKSILRKRIRAVREAIAAGQMENAEAAYKAMAISLDRAGTHRIVHPNAVARTKSRLQKLIKAAKG